MTGTRKRWGLTILLVGLIVTQAAAGSVIYQWRDDEGGLHFTDDPGRIPIHYWNHASRGASGRSILEPGDGRSTRVPLEQSSKAVLIPVMVNDKYPLSLYLDTGSTYCQITHDDARVMNLNGDDGRSVRVTMADGRSLESRAVVLESLRIGAFEVHGVEALVGDMRLLGLNALRQFRITLDLPRGEIILETTGQ